MKTVLAFLRESPLVVLFLVAAVGYLAGRVTIGGFGLGVAAVLFVGLAVGALDPELKLPELVQQFGLVLFVYSVGLASGPGFFASLRRRGLRDAGLAVGALGAGALVAVAGAHLAGIGRERAAGLFTGALTNTPALASVVESLKTSGASAKAQAEPIVAYSVAYPMGVVGVLVAIWLAQRLFEVDYDHEPLSLRDKGLAGAPLVNGVIRISRDQELPAAELRKTPAYQVAFGRVRRGNSVTIVRDDTRFCAGDLVSVVGHEADLSAATAALGEASDERIDLDRRTLDFRRMFVSRPQVTERPLRQLDLTRRFGAVVTRVRRGDVDLLADGDTMLELGDRVRVVAPRDRMDEIAAFLGDSYRALSEIDVITFSLGIALGLAIGSVPIPLPGGPVFKLGIAGGPLIVGLLLGRTGRTGPLVWTLPYSASLTLRQLGLVLFLAGIGTRSGHAFVTTLREGGGLALFALGAAVTFASAFTTLVVGFKVLRMPLSILVGTLSGVHTQPAALAFGLEQVKKELPNVGYASVFPVATVAKIVLAQLILSFV